MSTSHRVVAIDQELKRCAEELDSIRDKQTGKNPEIKALETMLFGGELETHDTKTHTRRIAELS